ncbi:MAG: ABC transporter ATP-binding protein [Acidimicrobiales bacterium]|nr:ABC transporter ATP-binding protein [Acidimicrobiales bacterium]
MSQPIMVREASVSYGDTAVLRSVDLDVRAGGIVALLGPSGCGKTTMLRAIAGLEHLDAGQIEVGGTLVSGPSRHVAPERRNVGMVFQDWALFPHLSVARNVAYGLGRGADEARVAEVLDLVGLSGFGDRSPQNLSGGQQQRVALARALAPSPTALLLDEPFSNLDTALRVEIRTEVHRLLSSLDVTTIFVTHDQDEAFILGDEVAVMANGRIVQQGSPQALYARPASPWIAAFVGEANLVVGTAAGTVATTPVGAIQLSEACHGDCEVLLRPEELELAAEGPGVVGLVEYYGHDTTYEVELPDTTVVRVRMTSTPKFATGDRVQVRHIGGTTVAYALAG